jgi:hypothetical protein
MLILTEDEKKYANYLPRTHQHIFEVIEGLPEPTYKAVANCLAAPWAPSRAVLAGHAPWCATLLGSQPQWSQNKFEA